LEKRKDKREKFLAFGNPDVGDPKLHLQFAEEEVKGKIFFWFLS
jgi:hypothetical protein